MIGISKLYCGTVEPSDVLRYGRQSNKLPSHMLQFSEDKKPVVVWNITRNCNLRCVHCYSHSDGMGYRDEMSTDDARKVLSDLGNFGVPVVLFSGGEPLVREDVLELGEYARKRGMRVVISTNGTMINRQVAEHLRDVGVSYVGVSLDGLRETNDRFRGVEGAFERALRGIRICKDAGIKVGLRFTINRRNVDDVPGIFDLLEEESIERICFYHLVYAGRGSQLVDEDLTKKQTRDALDLIIDRTADLHTRGKKVEVLTVDNHADGVYLYLRLLRENPERAGEVLKLLEMNGGNSSGNGIGCISWDGSVHADQFWRHYSFGNVKERPFSEIWTDLSNPLMKKLKNKKLYVKGRCARCSFLDVCGGNFRVRAEAVTGDVWAEEPACYLTDEEIGISGEREAV
jgi:12,18-didecarboxysiroheme deacetylase